LTLLPNFAQLSWAEMTKYSFLSILAAAIAVIASLLFAPLTLRIKVLGISRLFGSIKNIHGHDLQVIPDTLFCEDVHYHAPSGNLFAASEADEKPRFTWFPPSVSRLFFFFFPIPCTRKKLMEYEPYRMTNWRDPNSIGRGTIVVIDTKVSIEVVGIGSMTKWLTMEADPVRYAAYVA
jgi:hypothetical protein